MPINFNHHLIGRKVIYRDPHSSSPEEGIITSVNVDANLVFVRYGLNSTSAATNADERLTFLDGSKVVLQHSKDNPLDIGVYNGVPYLQLWTDKDRVVMKHKSGFEIAFDVEILDELAIALSTLN